MDHTEQEIGATDRSKISRILGHAIPLLRRCHAAPESMASILRCGFTLVRPMTCGSVLWNTSMATAVHEEIRADLLRVRVD